MPCAPHLASGDRDRDGWPGPRPTRPRPPPQSSNFTIAIFWVRVSQKNACQTHSLSIHSWETKPRWENAKKKKRKKKPGWFLAGGSFATFELCCVRPCTLVYRLSFKGWGFYCQPCHVSCRTKHFSRPASKRKSLTEGEVCPTLDQPTQPEFPSW